MMSVELLGLYSLGVGALLWFAGRRVAFGKMHWFAVALVASLVFNTSVRANWVGFVNIETVEFIRTPPSIAPSSDGYDVFGHGSKSIYVDATTLGGTVITLGSMGTYYQGVGLGSVYAYDMGGFENGNGPGSVTCTLEPSDDPDFICKLTMVVRKRGGGTRSYVTYGRNVAFTTAGNFRSACFCQTKDMWDKEFYEAGIPAGTAWAADPSLNEFWSEDGYPWPVAAPSYGMAAGVYDHASATVFDLNLEDVTGGATTAPTTLPYADAGEDTTKVYDRLVGKVGDVVNEAYSQVPSKMSDAFAAHEELKFLRPIEVPVDADLDGCIAAVAGIGDAAALPGGVHPLEFRIAPIGTEGESDSWTLKGCVVIADALTSLRDNGVGSWREVAIIELLRTCIASVMVVRTLTWCWNRLLWSLDPLMTGTTVNSEAVS